MKISLIIIIIIAIIIGLGGYFLFAHNYHPLKNTESAASPEPTEYTPYYSCFECGFQFKAVTELSAVQGENGDVSYLCPDCGALLFSGKSNSLEPGLKPKLKILAIGNSFNQDAMAYLPPVLNELLPGYDITYGVLYIASADIQKHIDNFNSCAKYTTFNYWKSGANAWERLTGDNSKTISEVLELEAWDIIFTQGTSKDLFGSKDEDPITDKIIKPAQSLLSLLHEHAQKPFTYMTYQWMGRPSGARAPEEMTQHIVDATNTIIDSGVFADYVPVGVAIQSARTNPTLQALGSATDAPSDMLYNDRVHMQAGIPALISAYTTALKIIEWVGADASIIYNSTWIPTDENCIAIGCTTRDSGTGVVHGWMTHGSAADGGIIGTDGAVDERSIKMINAAKEIALMAVKNPTAVTDFSDYVF